MMAYCKKDATPVREQWSAISFALSHLHDLQHNDKLNVELNHTLNSQNTPDS